jgi:phage repressor protein C with HTH and peptisase S24 domain
MSKDTRKTPLAAWQIEDSDRLKALFNEKKGLLKLTQEKIAAELGEGVTQGAVSHFLNKRTALSLRAAAVFARMLQVPVEAFSPTLAEELERLSGTATSSLRIVSSYEGEIVPPEPAAKDDQASAFAMVPQYTAKAAAGPGHDNAFVEERSSLAFKHEWLRAKRARPENLMVIYVTGDSMCPTICDGDVILVDRSRVDPAHNKLFLLMSKEDGLVVKRLMLIEDMWVIRSDSEDKVQYPDRYLPQGERFELDIQGQVLWRGGDL